MDRVMPLAMRPAIAPAGRTVAVSVAFVALVMLGAARAPLQLSLLAVVLLAGPHNWMELRYFLTHMPARWGPQRAWFITALGGVALLAASSWAMQWIGARLDDGFWQTAEAAWTISLLLWVGLLAHMRGMRAALPLAAAASVLVWKVPLPWDLLLVYLHPLVSLGFLDCELRTQPALRSALRLFLALLPALAAGVVLGADLAPVPAGLERVCDVAGAWLLPQVAPQRVVALHVFLQMLHYAAWIVALPLLRLKEAPWRTQRIPLRRRFPWLVTLALGGGGCATAALAAGFTVSLDATWDLYFTIAIVHVLAELPFLVRKLRR